MPNKIAPALVAVIALPVICSGAPPPAMHLALQIKTGLWEFTDTTKVAGDTVLPDAMTASVPAAQREQYLADVRKQLSQQNKVRECMTQAEFERQILTAGPGCAQTVVWNTTSRIEIQTACRFGSNGFRQDTDKHANASPASATTLMRAVNTRAGKAMTLETAESGHWVSASCGTVKGIEEMP